jgi:hypothetical protein
MKEVSILRHRLVYFLMQSPPSHVWVEIHLEGIYKGHPSGLSPKWRRFIHDVPLPVAFPPRSDMGKGFKKREGDIFFSWKTFG